MKASIIIPNRNDTVMLSVTVRSALEALKSVGGEVIVVDNSDEDIWHVLKHGSTSPLPLSEPNLSVMRQDFPSMYSARQTGFEKAKGEYILGCDSHTLWGHGVVEDVVSFMDANPMCGLGHSPVGWIDRPETFAKSEIQKNSEGGVFGPWGKYHSEPRRIAWHFAPRIARRDWLEQIQGYGFFAKKRVSWGGGEFYLAMKSMMMGRENWSIPTSPVYHIGPFNKSLAKVANYNYRAYGPSASMRQGIGILAAYYALGGKDFGYRDATRNRKSFEQYGIDLDRDWDEAVDLAKEDRQWIKEHQKITYEELLAAEPWNC